MLSVYASLWSLPSSLQDSIRGPYYWLPRLACLASHDGRFQLVKPRLSARTSHKELHPCEKILNDFLVDTGAKIVQDNGNSRSFYIRDRSCIESMSGSSQEILQIFSDEKSRFLFGTKCPSDLNPTGQPSGGDYFLFLIVSAISDLRGNVEAQIVANLLQASRIATADAYNFKK
jgi:hypothetical protein